ncbi:MAG: sugar phosphate isomerase/epimerase [Bryobacteraceae bacterium]|nr:sugar phosphate isomerase/epimerase [Bryobacteraceae bacterium]
MKRREFVLAAGVAAGAASASPAPRKLKVSVFSKHLQFLEGKALAEAAAGIGFDGVDLTVRKGGHVEPERVEADLPPLVKIIRAQGLETPMVTSGIVDADTPHARTVVKTLADLGIRYYRWGGFTYDARQPIVAQLEALKPRVAALEKLNREFGVCAMYHTHSGIGQVGASIWDLYLVLKSFDPDALGVNYDTAHAMVEGGFGGWINSFRVSEKHLRGIAVKDFLWKKDEKGRWRPQWIPLAEGMVDFPQFFQMLAATVFAGPVQVHYEYPLGGADTGQRTIKIPKEQVFAAMKADLERLRGWLASAGLG